MSKQRPHFRRDFGCGNQSNCGEARRGFPAREARAEAMNRRGHAPVPRKSPFPARKRTIAAISSDNNPSSAPDTNKRKPYGANPAVSRILTQKNQCKPTTSLATSNETDHISTLASTGMNELYHHRLHQRNCTYSCFFASPSPFCCCDFFAFFFSASSIGAARTNGILFLKAANEADALSVTSSS